jgi:uncharacterized membrane protein
LACSGRPAPATRNPLAAQTRGALAAVAALRATSVVVAAVLGAMFFGERFGRRRVVATVLVAAGVVLLNF